MEEQNISENIQEVAELEENVETTSEETQEVAEPETQLEETKVENSRDYERDSAYASMRKSMEQSKREYEAMKAEKERLASALGLFGFSGTTDDIEDQAKAHYSGRSVEEVRQERIAQAQKVAEENAIRDKLKYYEEKELKEQMDNDLKEIQKLNPAIKSFGDLPQEYFDLVAGGVEGSRAYKVLHSEGFFQSATQVAEQQAVAKIQANARASVGSTGNGEFENVSYANMSDADFEKLIAKVKRGEFTP